MTETKTLEVSHLGGITAGYKLSEPFSAIKPTLILVNSFTTSSELYAPWFAKSELKEKLNLLAIEPLSHGKTRAHKSEHWTYWDTAIMNLQVMEALGIEDAFALGTSQGGFICVRMAILAPQKVRGLILLGTMMDRETPDAVARGCWDGLKIGSSLIESWSTPDPDFEPTEQYYTTVTQLGYSGHLTPDIKDFWTESIRKTYSGEEGRKRLRMCGINLKGRDGLHERLGDIKCPVVWMQGTDDPVFSVANAQFELELFSNASWKELRVVEGGAHFLSASNPDEVEKETLALVKRVSSVGKI